MVNLHGSLADPQVQRQLTQAQERPQAWTVYLVQANGARRTEPQNRLYRSTLQKLAQQQGRPVSYWHDYLVERFLGHVERTTEDGITIRMLVSTAELTVEEFSGFLNACLAFASEMQVR